MDNKILVELKYNNFVKNLKNNELTTHNKIKEAVRFTNRIEDNKIKFNIISKYIKENEGEEFYNFFYELAFGNTNPKNIIDPYKKLYISEIFNEYLPIEVIQNMLLDMEYDDIINTCKTIKLPNMTNICKDYHFWKMKVGQTNPEDRQELFKKAYEKDYINYIKVLLKDENVDPSDQDNKAIRWVSENGHLEIFKLLLKDKRVNPADQNNYAIRLASEKGHFEIVQLIWPYVHVKLGYHNTNQIRFQNQNLK